MSPIGKLMKEVLQRPAKQRAVMARELIASLDPQGSFRTEKEWDKEIQRRIREVESGRVGMIPWSQVKSDTERIIHRQRAR
jgi:putative addiction module component (TIGR02574 family)